MNDKRTGTLWHWIKVMICLSEFDLFCLQGPSSNMDLILTKYTKKPQQDISVRC